MQPDHAISSGNAGKSFTYLALGDSYTIGHAVPPEDSFPYQTIHLLKREELYGELKIIAATGWTTADLKKGISNAGSNGTLLSGYDIVSLLIGVNNQYQGIDIAVYREEFEELLKQAVAFAGNRPEHVIVLSIPDWGITPFAAGRDSRKIAAEIDHYNSINKSVSGRYAVNYVNITPWSREAANNPAFLAPDELHPSGKEYARWAAVLQKLISRILQKQTPGFENFA